MKPAFVHVTCLLHLALLVVFATPLRGDEGKEGDYLRRGKEALQVKEYRKAATAFSDALRLRPDNAEAYRGMGEAYLKLGSSEVATNPEVLAEAATALQEAVRLDPTSVDAHYRLGLARLGLDDVNGARREQDALTRLDPELAKELGALIARRAPRPTFRPAGSGEGSVTRVSIAANQIFVPVTLGYGGKSEEASLILDTGASIMVISRELAEKLGMDLARAPRARVRVVGGGVVECWRMRLDLVSAGPHTKNSVDVAVVPPQAGGSFPYDGLLGMNFLRSYPYRLDVASRTITWMP